MTPRVEAWIRQAQNDLEAARFTAGQGFHAQACYLAAGITPPYSHSLEKLVELLQQQGLDLPALAELHLKALTRMNSASRYPQGDEAPADLFDANDSSTALGTAEAVVRIAMTQLQA